MKRSIWIVGALIASVAIFVVTINRPPAPMAMVTPVALLNTLTAMPKTLSATALLEPSPTTVPDLPALWVLDGAQNRQVAVDPQTGQVLNQFTRDVDTQIVSRDGRWQYSLMRQAKDNRWQVSVNMLDLTRSASPKHVLLTDTVPITTGSTREVSSGQLLLSKDERQLYVTQAQLRDHVWLTHVYIFDLMMAKVVQSLEVFSTDVTREPPLLMQSFLSSDERQLFVVENARRQPPATKNDPATWFTSIAVLNLDSGKVEQVVEVPGDVQAHGFGLSATLSANGQMLYLVEQIVRNSEASGYRFVALDTSKREIVRTQLVEQGKDSEGLCYALLRLRFTPDGRYFWGYCGPDHPIRPAGYFQFLDTQTGLVGPKIPLDSKIDPSTINNPFAVAQVIESKDYKAVYIISMKTKEVFVFDLAQRKVMRSTILSEAKSTSFNPLSKLLGVLSNWFVGTASAKMYPQPGVILSDDGQRLYVVDIVDVDRGNGLWGIETTTLKTIGHWLMGKDINGIQLSADNRELYAASPNDYSIVVLDAQTGETRRVLKQEQTVVKPIGFITPQN